MNYIKLPSGILVPEPVVIITDTVINDEVNNSGIGKKFKELEIQELINNYEDICGYDGI